MKFLIDVNVSPIVSKWLIDEGYDSSHLFDLKLHDMTDADIWALALRESRIIITCDLDFPYLLSLSEQSLPSVILFRLEFETPKNHIKWLNKILPEVNNALLKGSIVTISDKNVRIRSLPFQTKK